MVFDCKWILVGLVYTQYTTIHTPWKSMTLAFLISSFLLASSSFRLCTSAMCFLASSNDNTSSDEGETMGQYNQCWGIVIVIIIITHHSSLITHHSQLWGPCIGPSDHPYSVSLHKLGDCLKHYVHSKGCIGQELGPLTPLVLFTPGNLNVFTNIYIYMNIIYKLYKHNVNLNIFIYIYTHTISMVFYCWGKRLPIFCSHTSSQQALHRAAGRMKPKPNPLKKTH